MADIFQKALTFHKKHQGKLRTELVQPLESMDDLALAYTPGVAEPCRRIAEDESLSYDYTWRGRTVAVVSDGSAVLGLGNIGGAASLPVMEGKAVLLKRFGDVDAVPLVLNTQDPEKIIAFVRQLAPSFAGINLEDIAAPHCFHIEAALQDIGIPVFHDDQHGTAIVVSAALHNAAKVLGKKWSELRVVVVGAGAAGTAVTNMLLGLEWTTEGLERADVDQTVGDVIMVDSTGAIVEGRSDLSGYKKDLSKCTNLGHTGGTLSKVIADADVVIGVSGPGVITQKMISSMAADAIVFALANPTPEIMPDEARAAGAAIVATGRSDFANQINNVLAFPGIFKAVIEGRLQRIEPAMKLAAAQVLAETVTKPTAEKIIPTVFEPQLAEKIAKGILARATG
ncbi:MAG: NADP-dependent malic enzyme [Patescibacteria group bacterium]